MMDKSPLAMLAKACETIGRTSSNDPSPNKSKSHKSNGNSKAGNNRHSLHSPHHMNGNHTNYLDMNGKQHLKKENGQQQHRKGSPRSNGNPALNCEPSTSSPSSLTANGQQQLPHPFNLANGTFPGLLQRCFPSQGPPNGMGMNPFGMMPVPPPPGAFPGPFPGGANPYLMAAMAAFSGQGGMPPVMMPPMPSVMPQQQQTSKPNGSVTTTTTALAAPIPATSQPLPLTPPATNTSQKRSLATTGTAGTPTSASSINGHSQAEAEFAAALAAQQQMAANIAMFAPYNLPSMFGGNGNQGGMHPAAAAMMMQAMAGGGGVPPMDNGFGSPVQLGQTNSVQAMLMAAACGQQLRHHCTYPVKGTHCGKAFDNDIELFAHMRQHLPQLAQSVSSPMTVSSTTTEPTVSTASSSAPPSTPAQTNGSGLSAGGGKMKTAAASASVKHSPVSPKHSSSSLPPSLYGANGLWNPSTNTPVSMPLPMAPPPANRFHPYKMAPQPPTSMAQQFQQQQHQAMAAAMQHQHQQQMMMAQFEYAVAAAAAAGMPVPNPYMMNMPNQAQQMAMQQQQQNQMLQQAGNGGQQQQSAIEKSV